MHDGCNAHIQFTVKLNQEQSPSSIPSLQAAVKFFSQIWSLLGGKKSASYYTGYLYLVSSVISTWKGLLMAGSSKRTRKYRLDPPDSRSGILYNSTIVFINIEGARWGNQVCGAILCFFYHELFVL